VYDDLIKVLRSKDYGLGTFPCIYATKGWKSNDQRYVYVDSADPSEPRNVRRIAKALRAYLPRSREYGENTTLVLLCPPSEPIRSVEQYNIDFWSFLRGLRVLDSKPWPEEIPAETTSNKWAFCFDGSAWFPAVLTPAHIKRRSRYAPNLVYVMQPKWIFDILFNTPEKRYSACTKVRSLVEAFDEVPISPDVAHYGEPGTTESRQYYLLEENQRSYCPVSDLL
jgi:FPC/CPF motif-containing protein YcgG